jgi:probable F420-dependent oxidoreductase
VGTSIDLRARLGPLGIWTNFDAIGVDEVARFAATIEELGFGTLWLNESSAGREPFAMLGALARETTRLTLGLGVAPIYARDATAAHNGARTLADLSGGRFVMGLGVSHRSSVSGRGHIYAPPIGAMTAYLDAYAAAAWSGPAVDDPPVVLAALGPRMLALAAARTAGAFAYLVTAAQVAQARQTLDAAADPATGLGRPVLIVSLPSILGSGPEVDAAARSTVGRHLAQPNYRANLLRGGFTADQIDSSADPLVRGLVATGDPDELRSRIGAMLAAGADHVAVIPISPAGRQADLATTRAVALERA